MDVTRPPPAGRHWPLPAVRHGPLAAAVLLGVALAFPRPAGAVTHLEQAERLQHINAFLLDLRPGEAPRVPESSVLEVTAEAIPQPELDTRVGRKDEPLDAPSAVPRGRVRYIGDWGMMLGVTWNPDVTLMGYSAPWLGQEIGFRFHIGKVHAELRGYSIAARVTGPITERGADDTFDVENQGVDFRAGYDLGAAMVYAGQGQGHTESTLTVESDGAELKFDTDYTYVLAGITYETGPFAFTFEQHRTEDYLDHFILAPSYRFE